MTGTELRAAGDRVATERINARFNGPPESANGGYACGVVARHLEGPASVTLRMPPPLERDLAVVAVDGGAVHLLEGDTVIAEGRPAVAPTAEPPVRPSFAEAVRARERHPGRGIRHLLSDCFVCGPERGDGLGVSPGPVDRHPDLGAAPLVARPELAGPEGSVASEYIWAALDCPSYPPRLWRERRLSLLGRLTAARHREVAVGEQLVVVGWMRSTEGRKHHTASAIIDADGELVARAEAIWIELRT